MVVVDGWGRVVVVDCSGRVVVVVEEVDGELEDVVVDEPDAPPGAVVVDVVELDAEVDPEAGPPVVVVGL